MTQPVILQPTQGAEEKVVVEEPQSRTRKIVMFSKTKLTTKVKYVVLGAVGAVATLSILAAAKNNGSDVPNTEMETN
jgi:hypothetical protein